MQVLLQAERKKIPRHGDVGSLLFTAGMRGPRDTGGLRILGSTRRLRRRGFGAGFGGQRGPKEPTGLLRRFLATGQPVRYNPPGMLFVLLLILALLLLLNAFFALAEFAAVKIRSTWVEQLEIEKHPSASLVRHIHEHVDDYLSVVQVGITFTSIGLGFVGEPAMARLLTPVMAWAGNLGEGFAHGAAITIGYVSISFLHIVVGELVPKGIAVRAPERSALLTAAPMKFFYYVFHLPRIVLRGTARFVLRLLGVKSPDLNEGLSEEEIRGLLGRWGVSRQIYVADTDARALEEARPYELWYQESFRRFVIPERIEDSHPSLQPGFRAMAERLARVTWEDLRAETLAFGSPDTVARHIEVMRGLGVGQVLCWMNFGGLPQDKIRRSMELFAREVMPRFPRAES